MISVFREAAISFFFSLTILSFKSLMPLTHGLKRFDLSTALPRGFEGLPFLPSGVGLSGQPEPSPRAAIRFIPSLVRLAGPPSSSSSGVETAVVSRSTRPVSLSRALQMTAAAEIGNSMASSKVGECVLR